MCASCGCGEVNKRHKPGDIVMEDLQKAAQNHDLSTAQVGKNLQEAASKSGSGSGKQS